MNREHRLSYCKICNNQKMDLKKGLICRLTNERADFDLECSDFSKNDIKAAKLKEETFKREIQEKYNDDEGGISAWGVIKIILVIGLILLKLMRLLG